MSLIPSPDQDRLRRDFQALQHTVTLLLFTRRDGSEACAQARTILDELPPLSERILLEELDIDADTDRAAAFGIDRVPAIVLVTGESGEPHRDTRIRFFGAPAGHEFIAVLRAILLAGGGPSMLSAANRRRIMAVDRPMDIRVFTTPTCAYCPRAVVLAHEMAFLNPHITACAVEATAFPDLAARYRVTGVPKTVVDDRIEILGALPEDEFVAQALGVNDGGPATAEERSHG